jgi:hypothetical protein
MSALCGIERVPYPLRVEGDIELGSQEKMCWVAFGVTPEEAFQGPQRPQIRGGCRCSGGACHFSVPSPKSPTAIAADSPTAQRRVMCSGVL